MKKLIEIENFFSTIPSVQFIGIQKSLATSDIALFNDVYTGSTLALFINDLTLESVKQKLITSRKEF